MIPDPKEPNHSPEAIVLDILSSKPRLTVKDLYDFFVKRYKPGMSLQGFYNLIHKLIKQRVLIKEGKLISIDGAWIYNLLNFANSLQENYFGQRAAATNILLEEGESKTFTLETVMEMDNFWWHALIVVILYYAQDKKIDKHAYAYVEYCWFQLVRTNSEAALNDAYKQHKMNLYHVGGVNNFLNFLTPRLIEGENVKVKIKNIKEFEKNYYVVVIGDFIFETALPNYIKEQMEKIYESVTDISQFDSKEILEIVQQPARTKLTITRDKKRAEKIRKRIKQCFK